MKKWTLTALVLTLISGICACLIACVNMLTSPIINENNEIKKEKLCQEIFVNYDSNKSTVISDNFKDSSISEVILASDEGGTFIGYIYTVAGSNAYGEIKLLLGVTSDYKLSGVRFITNGQSFSSEADSHLNNSYKENMTENDIDNIDLSNSDVTAGATYASKLIRDLVKSAFSDAKTRGGNS